MGCGPWGCEESDTTERLHFHFSLHCIEGGNGNPLQCSCLESPRHGGAWWAAVYGVAQSRTRLKRLGSGAQTWLGGGGKFVAALTHTVDVPRRGGPCRARLSTAVGAQSSF